MAAPPIFEFPAPILKRDAVGFLAHHYMPLPPEIAEELIESGTKRVILRIAGREANRAIHRSKNGEYHLVLGTTVLRSLRIDLGDVVIAELRSDPNPDQIDLPPEFEEALDQDPEASARFFGFTPGKRRSVATYIDQAKRPETRIKRALEMAHKLRTYTLYGDTPPNK